MPAFAHSRNAFSVAGRAVGVACALVSGAGWLILAVLYPVGADTLLLCGGMLGLSAVALWSALRGVSWLLAAAGAAALVPVGVYLAGVPGPMRIVGYAAIGYLAAAALMYVGRARGS
jgi:hypothetical protein